MKRIRLVVIGTALFALFVTTDPAFAATGQITGIERRVKLEAGGIDVLAATSVICDVGTTAYLSGEFRQVISNTVYYGYGYYSFLCSGASQTKHQRQFAQSGSPVPYGLGGHDVLPVGVRQERCLVQREAESHRSGSDLSLLLGV
jgi:hypothetical protein